jgi:alcohol dehydrogenase class IV
VFGCGNSFKASQRHAINAKLTSQGLSVKIISGVCSDTPFDELHRLCVGIDSFDPTWVVAIGGGGVIDIGKIIAVKLQGHLAVHVASCFEELEQRVSEIASLPLLAAPTCVGSGAEVSSLADVLLDSGNVRVPIISPRMFPKTAIVDVAVASPPRQVQASAFVDAFTHLLDPWLNSLPQPPHEEITVSLLRSLVRITQHWRTEGFDGASLVKFTTVSHLAVRPGLARSSAAISVVHRIEHVLTPLIGCSHGEGLAILLAPFLRWLEQNRPKLMIGVANHFSEIFGRNALPSTLVSEWLDSLCLRECSLSLSEVAIDEISDSIMHRFADADGMLPGTLSIRRSDIQDVLRKVAQQHSPGDTPATTRMPTLQVNTKRLFGILRVPSNPVVVVTPISGIFRKLCESLGVPVNHGWYQTALFNASRHTTILVCPPPGSSMAEDCLQFLLATSGLPQSILFLGFAGSLTSDLRCGDIVSPKYVWTLNDSHGTRLVSATQVASVHGNHNHTRTWTVRSIPRLTDESEELLEAWRWSGTDLVDLESGSIAQFCAINKILMRMILIVSDNPLDQTPIWAQPPLNDESVVSISMERVATYTRDLIAHGNQLTSKGT